MLPEISVSSAACTFTNPPAPFVPDEALTVEASVTEAPVEVRKRLPPLLPSAVPSSSTCPERSISPAARKLNLAGRRPEPCRSPLNDTDDASTTTEDKANELLASAVKAVTAPVLTPSAPQRNVELPVAKSRRPPGTTCTARVPKSSNAPDATVVTELITQGSTVAPHISSASQTCPGIPECSQAPVTRLHESTVQARPSSHSALDRQPGSSMTATKASVPPARVGCKGPALIARLLEAVKPAT